MEHEVHCCDKHEELQVGMGSCSECGAQDYQCGCKLTIRGGHKGHCCFSHEKDEVEEGSVVGCSTPCKCTTIDMSEEKHKGHCCDKHVEYGKVGGGCTTPCECRQIGIENDRIQNV